MAFMNNPVSLQPIDPEQAICFKNMTRCLTGCNYWARFLFLCLLSATALSAEPETDPAESEPLELTVDRTELARERQIGLGSEGDDIGVEEATDLSATEPVTTELIFYGSGRVRLTAGDSQLKISDNRSRVGMSGFKFISSNFDVFMRVELGTDLGSELDDLFIPGDNPPDNSDGTFFPRIGKLGIGTAYGDFMFGKQWSAYYNVAGLTDRFAVFGAQGTVVYNAGTDGGGSGTGLADGAFINELNRKKLSLALQGQNNTDIPLATDRQYDSGIGTSVSYEWSSGLSAGLAYNRSFIDDVDAELAALGITGDRQAAVAGIEYSHRSLLLATTVSSNKNHAATDQLEYIDAYGWELYARYNLSERLRVIGGTNLLEPDDNDPQAGRYDIRSAILGMQYTYGKPSFGNMVYFECELNRGHTVAGEPFKNAYTVGIRYSFEL
jgi:predicted porin